MKKKTPRSFRLLLSSLIILAIIGTLFLFLTGTKHSGQHPADTQALTEQSSEESEHAKELHLEELLQNNTENIPAEDTPLSTEAFLAQDRERIRSLPAGELAAAGIIEPSQIDRLFFAGAVDDAVLTRILGNSYTENDNVRPEDLSYLRMLYYGFDGNTYVGEMIVNQKIESEVLEIFKTLYKNQYPIEKMILIDEYGADDTASMEANNTSAFNYRTISGSSKLSNHSYGMAIDLNPKYNPYVKTSADGSILCQPESGREYADRSKDFAYKIDENDLAYRLFTKAGFTWGGNWNSVKDYQHFEK